MFISPRGTSGSGKTTLARLVLDGTGIFGLKEKKFLMGRKNPLYYVRERLGNGRPIAVLGSYENITGGADTLNGNHIPFELFRKLDAQGMDVLCEGLLHSAEQGRTAQLHRDGYDVRLFYLTIPLADCIAGVQARRDARGKTEPLNTDATRNRWSALRHHWPRFQAMGVNCQTGDRKAGIRWLIGMGLVHPDDEMAKKLLEM